VRLSLPPTEKRDFTIMTISYNWLCQYLPERIEPQKLGKILTNLGLEVESLSPFETVKGSLAGLVVGEVLDCGKHPQADKLWVAMVNVGGAELLQIVCGAPNVAVGQKVVVAPVGCTICPQVGDPIAMKKAKIRGVDSFGMICAEDEIGLGTSHDGIVVLPPATEVGTPVADVFKPYTDWIYEIGLTPNRMDAMSHLGVARDVSAWLNHHQQKGAAVVNPLRQGAPLLTEAKTPGPIGVHIQNSLACRRYVGVAIGGIQVAESPHWLQNRLKAIGVRPINNVVDVTNFILHETGQPLHAFDLDAIGDSAVVVKNMPHDTPFVTLDGKERRLHPDDLMICNGAGQPLCIGGVFGGLGSGVVASTTRVFIESAWFDPVAIRKTSFRHGLRTDAATRFEKGVDIGNCALVLQRAAKMLMEICGGNLLGDVVDVYPAPQPRTEVSLKFHYLKKLSGKHYHPDTVKGILESLGFEFLREGANDFWFAVPYSKPDIAHAADVVEEIMRIDGYDNVEIPAAIMMSPSPDLLGPAERRREQVSNYLCGAGFSEIVTNSITNSAYYTAEQLGTAVAMLNNLSTDLNLLRPHMLETSLEAVAYNLNRRNFSLQLFEFGKTYHRQINAPVYDERQHCCLVVSGQQRPQSWNKTAEPADFFVLKGLVQNLMNLLGIGQVSWQVATDQPHVHGLTIMAGAHTIGHLGVVHQQKLQAFGIKQPVVMADLDWGAMLAQAQQHSVAFTELNKYPTVERDLSIVVTNATNYAAVEKAIGQAQIGILQASQVVDLFEGEILGEGKKSLTLRFTFADHTKTLTDKETDAAMQRLVQALENNLAAEIRR
jgi:phenylalanyl-tRNA synthetase beta chain